MTIAFPTLTTTKQRVHAALAIFRANDICLLQHNLSERAIAHKFAEALQTTFRSWHVDVEYNRDGLDPKRITWPHPYIDDPTRRVFPDIIIHRRGSTNNLLAIELKKANTLTPQQRVNDHAKLTAYIHQLGYRYALFAVFKPDVRTADYYDLTWFPKEPPK